MFYRNRVADVAAQHSAEAFLYDFGCFALTSMLDGDQASGVLGEPLCQTPVKPHALGTLDGGNALRYALSLS